MYGTYLGDQVDGWSGALNLQAASLVCDLEGVPASMKPEMMQDLIAIHQVIRRIMKARARRAGRHG